MLDKSSSKIEKIVQEAKKTSKTVVFLGGSCKDNAWREGIQKEFGDHFFFIDPYDENYEFKDNVYDELAGIVNADYVLFYRGGELTGREKDFLENIDRRGKSVKEFDDLDKLKTFLKGITGKKKLASVSMVLRKYALALYKEAMLATKDNVDLFVERMAPEDRKKIKKDLDSPKNIGVIVPEGISVRPGTTTHGGVIHRSDFGDKEYEDFIKPLLESNKVFAEPVLEYDEATHTVRHKEAKIGATYSKGSTQIDLPEQLAQEIMAWGKTNVPDKDLYTKDDDKGREDEIHVTLFYGIVEDAEDKIREMMSGVKPFECRLGLVTAFKDVKEYDVLKIDIESPELVKLHYLIQDNVKNKNKYPTYTPHVSIAYLKKDKANGLIGEDRFRGTSFKVTEIVYSTKDHDKIKIPLGS